MTSLVRKDLLTLEAYAASRDEFRARVMEHKKSRRLLLGENVLLLFEDRLTVQYQVQEMLRVERIFEAAAIAEELATYNPLIPDGCNWKATMMIQFPDPHERQAALERLIGIEDRVWVRVSGQPAVTAIADEDLERSTDTKTSAVHFLRFELNGAMCAELKRGALLHAGVSHPEYTVAAEVTVVMRDSLLADLA